MAGGNMWKQPTLVVLVQVAENDESKKYGNEKF